MTYQFDRFTIIDPQVSIGPVHYHGDGLATVMVTLSTPCVVVTNLSLGVITYTTEPIPQQHLDQFVAERMAASQSPQP